MLRAFLAVLIAAVLVGAGGALPASADLPKPSYDATPTVLLNEAANGGPRFDADSFFELRNWGDEAVDLTGWEVYRCTAKGLRSNVGRLEGDLTGIVLDPGEIVTVSRIGLAGQEHISVGFDLSGFGLFLEAPDDTPVDMLGVYPNEPWPTQSECTPPGGNLPNVLDFAQGESWQRVAATGDPARDWIVAPATIDAPNATVAPRPSAAQVVVSELAGAGAGGSADDFVELRNDGDDAVDLGGWQVFRCSATGRVRPGQLQVTIAAGTRLEPGETWVAGAEGFTGDADARYATPLADRAFGILVRDAAGALVDRVAVSAHDDSACQGAGKLPALLDMARGESHQLADDGTWVMAPRTPGRANAQRADALYDPTFAYPERADVGIAISEVATDPAPERVPAGYVQQNFIEIGNYGDGRADIGGWTAWRCMADGARAATPQFTVPAGTVLDPGEVYLAARAGTALAADADAVYDTALSLLGAGVWLADDTGDRVDSVGIFAANEFDAENVVPSPCTKGFALTTYQPDRLLHESFRRSRFTGVDADDFLAAPATPGTIDELPWVDPTERVDITPDAVEAPAPEVLEAPVGDPVAVLAAWGGVTELGPLASEAGEDEIPLDPGDPGVLTNDAYGYPYQRLVLDAEALRPGSTVSWQGTGRGRTEVQLSVWTGEGWRLLDAGTGDVLVLHGELEEREIRDGEVMLLVQNGPRTQATLASGMDGALEDPAAYDVAISHITDTQYLAESYPEVYAGITSWIAANHESRKIAFATHTGDLIQNWVSPGQNTVRAHREFATASAIQAILDDAGVPNSVLPGNHDNLRGATSELFNAYFPVSRYSGQPWFGGSIAPDDNSANFSTFTVDGARFLMLSLPYAFGDAEMAWAAEVVASHPDHNVILSTHEHVAPKTVEGPAHRATSNRWVTRGRQLWDRVIAPNRNVVLVLAGHYHGLGQIRTEDAGGIPGHTVTELLADYQEYRTHTGERATGFQRLLQIDLAGGAIAVDTFSLRLGASYGFAYDYRQFVPDNGDPRTASNARPWRIVESGLQGRYTEVDDEFTATANFQYPKAVGTLGVLATDPAPSVGAVRHFRDGGATLL